MKIKSDTELHQRLEEVKKLASRMMHMHYCEHDTEGIISCFSDRGKPLAARWCVYLMLLFSIPLLGQITMTGGGFIYAQF